MKRKLNIRKLILSLSTIGMLALTTTASTYAWFKINAKASVENFNFEVIGGKGTYKEPYIIRNTNNFIEDE